MLLYENDDYYENLTAEKIRVIIDNISNQEVEKKEKSEYLSK
jgi:hypothetical protein